MRKKHMTMLLGAALFCMLFAAGCGAKDNGTGAEKPTAAASDSGLRMTQEQTVKKPKYEDREEFADFLSAASPSFRIPGLNQAMTPQGITYSEATGLAYISSYAGGETPSAISAVDLATGEFVAEYYLFQADGSPFTSHVGGIAVTENSVYLSAKLDSDGSYSVAVLPLAELPTAGSHNVTVEKNVAVPVSPSFINYSGGMLWIGNFYHPEADYGLPPELNHTTQSADGEYGCYVLGYALDPETGLPEPAPGENYPVPDCILAAPDRIQGITYSENRVFLSQSYGRKNNSTVLVYSLALTEDCDTEIELCGERLPAYILDSRRQSAALTAMPMTEGLCAGPNGSVLILFESGASRYSDGKYRTDCVWQMPADGFDPVSK